MLLQIVMWVYKQFLLDAVPDAPVDHIGLIEIKHLSVTLVIRPRLLLTSIITSPCWIYSSE